MSFEEQGSSAMLQKVRNLIKWGAASAAISLSLAGCGGGDDPGLSGEAQTQRDQTASTIRAQQSVTALMAAVIQPGSGTENFEAGIGDWQNWGNAQVVSGAGVSGSSALQVGPSAGGAALKVPSVVGGTTYRLTAQVRATDPVQGPTTLGVDFYNASGSRIIGTRAPSNVTSTSFAAFSYDVTAPAGTAYALAWVWKNGSTGFAYVDDVTFGPASAPPPPPPPPADSNLIANGGFEAGMSGWTDWGNTQVVAGQGNAGSAALTVGTGAGGAGYSVDGIVPGKTYRLAVSAKTTDAGDLVYVGVNFVDAGGSLVSNVQRSIASKSYIQTSADVVAPTGAVKATVYVWKNAGSGVGYVDDYVFAAASASTPPPTDQLTPNLLVNGAFNGSLYGWQNWGNANVPPGSQYTQNWWLNVGTGAGGVGQRVSRIEAGKTYRLYGRMSVTVAGETGYLGLKFLDAAGNTVQDQVVPFSSTTLTTASLTLVAPSNAASALAYVWKNAGSGLFVVDGLTLAQVGVAPSPPALVQISGSAQERVDTPDGLNDRSGQSIARLANGNYVVAWVSGAGAGSASYVCFQRLDANLARLGPNACVAGAQPIGSADAPGQGDLSGTKVLPRPDGGFVIVWNVKAGTTDSGYHVLLGERSQAFDAAGTPVGGIQDGPQQPVPTRAAVLTGGGYVVVSGSTSNVAPDVSNLSFQRYSADGTPIGSPTTVGDRGGGGAQVVPLSGGGFAVGWREYSRTYTRMFTADGTPVGEPVLVAVETSFCTTAPDCFSESLSGLIPMEDGGYLVIWREYGDWNLPTRIFARRFRPDGSPGTAVTQLSVDFSPGAAAPAGSDGFVGVWGTSLAGCCERQILMQRFDATPLR